MFCVQILGNPVEAKLEKWKEKKKKRKENADASSSKYVLIHLNLHGHHECQTSRMADKLTSC